jgi:WD40 repeat protein/class 3 adenylate cyclase
LIRRQRNDDHGKPKELLVNVGPAQPVPVQTGVVTLLFTDIVSSTALKQRLGDKAGAALIQQQRALVRQLLNACPGAEEIETAGDSFLLSFAKPSDAVRFALVLQSRLRGLNEGQTTSLEERIGIHLGEVVVEQHQVGHKPKDLYGIQIDTCSRVMSLAKGGQVLMSRGVFDSARQVLKGEDIEGVGTLEWLNHGPYVLKGLDEPVEICEVREAGQGKAPGPPTSSEKAQLQVRADEEPVLGWRPAVGQSVPNTRWVLEKKLGEGGFGEVWLGRHQHTKERRVFKFCFQAERVRYLKREMTLFRLLKERVGEHPNITRLHDVFLEHPPFYVEMDYVEGADLRVWCEERGGIERIPLETRLEIVAQAAEGLQAAHEAGVIHRDVKPANILVEMQNPHPASGHPLPSDGRGAGGEGSVRVKLTDFGIGQVVSEEYLKGITRAGFTQTIMSDSSSSGTGTHLYMAPELVAGKPASIRSDIYSLGVVLYQLVVGDFTRPVTTDWANDIADPLLREDLRHCFAGNPQERFAGAGQLAKQLRALPERRAELARQQAEQAARERAAYRRGMMRAAAGATLIVLLVTFLALYASREASRATREAHHAKDAEAAARKQVVRMTVANGVRLHDEGETGEALLWFARSLSLVEGDSTEEQFHRLRFASVLRECPRLEQIFQHDNLVNHVEFSPRTARHVVTTCLGDNPVARVWDTVTGEPVTPALRHRDTVYGASFSPDGRSVVTASRDHTAQVWDASTGRPITTLQHGHIVTHAAFSPDGEQVLTASFDRTAQLWNARTGERVLDPFRHDAEVGWAVFSADGSRIATADIDSTTRVWDAKTGHPLSPLLKHGGPVNSVMFFPDGQRVMTASWDRTVRIWEALSGQPIGQAIKHKSGVLMASLSSDGSKVATREADETAHVWEVATGKELFSFYFKDDQVGHWLGHSYLPGFSSDGEFLVTVDKNGSARLLDANTGAPVSMPLQHNAPLLDAAFSRDAHHLVTSSIDHTARVWDITPALETNSKPRFRLVINRVPKSHDGRRMIIAGDDRKVRVVEPTTGKAVAVLNPDGPIDYAAFSPDDRAIVTVVSTGEKPSVRVWNAETGLPLAVPLEHKSKVYFAFFSPDGRGFVTCSGFHQGTASIFQTATGRPVGKNLEHKDYIEQVSFSPDGTRVVTASADATARVWSAKTGEAITPAMKHASGVAYAAFSTDGRLIVTASYDRTARVWDATTGEPLTPSFRHAYPVRQAAFTSDNHHIITACEDGLRAWKLATDDRPVADLVMLAQVLTGMQVNTGGATFPFRAEEARAAWQKLRSKYPGDSVWNGAEGLTAKELSSEEQSHLTESLAQFQRAQNLAVTNAQSKAFPIDISQFHNGRLTNDWFDGDPAKATPGLSDLRLGLQKLADVSFDVLGVVQVSGGVTKAYGPECPDEIRNIPVNRKCQLIHFLHGAFRTDKDQRLGSYVLRFAGGATWEIPVLGGYDVHSLNSSLTLESPKHSVVAWTGKWGRNGDPARLFRTTWEIPWPDLPLESVDIIGNMGWGAPFLVGITVE